MDEATSPLISGLGWTIAWEPAARDFIGRATLERERTAGPVETLAGLVLSERGVMRRGQRVLTAAGAGEITSGGFSPTMNCSVALARVPTSSRGDCQVEIRGALRPARLVKPPFVRHGRVRVNQNP
jgi:aminomethyltransferase